jgi:hypothetical protein
MATLLITAKEVKAQSQLGGNIDSEKLKIPIRIVQDLQMRNLLGGSLYDRIEALFIAGSWVISLEPYKSLFEDYFKVTAILYVAAKFTMQTPIEVNNGGANNYEPSNGSSSTRANIVAQAKLMESDAETYADRMIKYIRANVESFPEYSVIIEGDVTPDTNPYFCGIELEDNNYGEVRYL